MSNISHWHLPGSVTHCFWDHLIPAEKHENISSPPSFFFHYGLTFGVAVLFLCSSPAADISVFLFGALTKSSRNSSGVLNALQQDILYAISRSHAKWAECTEFLTLKGLVPTSVTEELYSARDSQEHTRLHLRLIDQISTLSHKTIFLCVRFCESAEGKIGSNYD